MTDKIQNVTVYQNRITPLVEDARRIKITNEGEMNYATDVLSKLNQINDAITTEKERVTKPLNEALKAERARWKPLEDMYGEAIALIRKGMSTYQTAETKRIAGEEAKLVARVGDGKGKLKASTAVKKMEEIERPQEKVMAKSGMVKFRTDYVLKIVDEGKIPAKFLVVDQLAVKAALKSGEKVPGALLEEVQTPINFR